LRHLEKKDGETGGGVDEEMEELDSFPICHFAFFICRLASHQHFGSWSEMAA